MDKASNDGRSPLYWASYNGHLEVVKTLLAAGAEVDKANSDGQTPLFWALHFGYTEIALLLREAEHMYLHSSSHHIELTFRNNQASTHHRYSPVHPPST